MSNVTQEFFLLTHHECDARTDKDKLAPTHASWRWFLLLKYGNCYCYVVVVVLVVIDVDVVVVAVVVAATTDVVVDVVAAVDDDLVKDNLIKNANAKLINCLGAQTSIAQPQNISQTCGRCRWLKWHPSGTSRASDWKGPTRQRHVLPVVVSRGQEV